ncbi:MAG: hypothetical protein ACRDFB_10710, partial [Rhabdochlamydiaceae bacterium]
ALSTVPCVEENNEPFWYTPNAKVHITQYKNWREVAQKIAPLYSLSKDLKTSVPPEMTNLIEKWKEVADDPIEQATLALRFVQDEIRYQGLEDGIGAFKPTDPWIILERRFGDCKDKSFLLHTLLKFLDIESTFVLVNSNNGKNIPNRLPNPSFFNHVVLKISINGENYWVDPTMRLQGGNLVDNYFPGFEWGLSLSEELNGLIQLPQEVIKKPTEIETSIHAKTPDFVEMVIETTRYGGRADHFRSRAENIGLNNFFDNNLRKLKRKYGTVNRLSPISVSDDRANNIFVTKESFMIPTKTQSGKKIFKTHSFVFTERLDDNLTSDRACPYAISYPLWVKEHITLVNPYGNEASESDELKVENSSFRYFYTYHHEGEHTEITYEIKHLEDHIPTELINAYWNGLDEIKSRNIDEIAIFVPK